MKKVLFFSNVRITCDECVRSGTWIFSMINGIASSGIYRVGNITCASDVSRVIYENVGGVDQWLLPRVKLNRDGLPGDDIISEIKGIMRSFSPDIVHIWGLENYFGLLVSRGIIRNKCLLEMQGIRHAIAPFFAGNLTFFEQLRCVGLKEILRPKTSFLGQQVEYSKMRRFEKEVVGSFKNIAYQSEWVRSYLTMMGIDSKLFPAKIMLRNEFIEGPKWDASRVKSVTPTVYTTCGATIPYKGLFTLLRAISIIKDSAVFKDGIKLQVAGSIGKPGIRSSGYWKWIQKEISRLGITSNVQFVGSQNALSMREQMLMSHVFVHPSFVESYSLAVAEAMCVGVPCVLSAAAAITERAVDGRSALFFPPGDAYICADRIVRLVQDDKLSQEISRESMLFALNQHNPEAVIARQLKTYAEILEEKQ